MATKRLCEGFERERGRRMAGSLHTLYGRKRNARELRQLTLGSPQKRAPSRHLRANPFVDGLAFVLARRRRRAVNGHHTAPTPCLDRRGVGRERRFNGSKQLRCANVETCREAKQRVERQICFALFDAPELPSLEIHAPRGLLDTEAERFAACSHR